jgi:hypothetical protein
MNYYSKESLDETLKLFRYNEIDCKLINTAFSASIEFLESINKLPIEDLSDVQLELFVKYDIIITKFSKLVSHELHSRAKSLATRVRKNIDKMPEYKNYSAIADVEFNEDYFSLIYNVIVNIICATYKEYNADFVIWNDKKRKEISKLPLHTMTLGKFLGDVYEEVYKTLEKMN